MTELSQEAKDILQSIRESNEAIKPINSGLITEPNEDDIGFWKTLGDMALAVPKGVVNAVEEQGDFIDENIVNAGGIEVNKLQALTLVNPILAKKYYEETKSTFTDFIPRYVTPSAWKSKDRRVATFTKPETMAGNMTEGVSRFLTGFFGPNKFLKGVGLTGGVVKTGIRGMTAGAVADLTVFDPDEGRLSDMLVEFNSPLLNNAVTQYLATDEDDTEMEGRLKNVLEGIVIGGPLEILMGIKAFKRQKATQNISEKNKIHKEYGAAIKSLQEAKKKQKLKPIDVGVRVVADDRGNVGTVLSMERGAIKVEFISKEGLRATKTFKKSELKSIDKTPLKLDPIVKKKIAEGNAAIINVEQAIKDIEISKANARADSESFMSKILNVKSFKNANQVLKTIDDLSDLFDEQAKEFLTNDVLRNDVADELATIMARDKSEVLRALPKEAARAKEAVIRMLATKKIIQEIAIDAKNSGEKYLKEFGDDATKWSKEAKTEIALRSAILRDTLYYLKEQIRGAARVTQAGNIPVSASKGNVLEVEKMADIVKRFSGDPVTISKQWRDGNIQTVIETSGKTKGHKAIEVFNSLYINSLLSGIYTNALNMKSGLYEAIIRPLEQIAGGAIRADGRSIRLGFAQYQGMIMTMGDTIRATGLAIRQGDAILDPLSRTQDNLTIVGGKAQRAISGSNLGFNGTAGTAIDWVGNILEFPSRLLMTGDEFLKQANYRGRLFQNALDNTMERGLKLSSKEGKENIDKIFKDGFDANGAANVKDNPFNKEALDYARESTYTNDLRGGSHLNWGSALQNMLNKNPEFRFLAPFIRTPTNLWRHFSNRIPGLGLFTKQNMDLWKSGDRRARAEVLGRQMLGISAAFYGYHLATESLVDKNGNGFPKLTGNGPANFQIKKAWMALGWQPYSIGYKKEDGSIGYKQYNRMDPRFYILGIIADLKENSQNINDEQKQDMFTSAAISVFKNATNKTYLRGISDAMELLSTDSPNKFSKFFGGVVGNAIPYASLRNQGIPYILEPDETAYEIRGFVDSIKNRAGMKEDLEPKRDLLTGEPIEKTPNSLYLNPDGILSYSSIFQGFSLVGRETEVKDNTVLFEVARLKIPMTEPAKIKFKTVDLTTYKIDGQSAHNYLIERIGKTTNGRGETLMMRLDRQFKSYSYLKLQEGDVNYDGGKEYQIKKIIENYKKRAERDMLIKYKDVANAINDAKKTKFGKRKKKTSMDEADINRLLP
tara:strand:+ start:1919 stop:5617 length:3699 start_codon:yes stop_codon:yes gene_type:complete